MRYFRNIFPMIIALFGASCSTLDMPDWMYDLALKSDSKAAIEAAVSHPDELMGNYTTMDLSGYTGINYLVGQRDVAALQKALEGKIKINEIKRIGRHRLDRHVIGAIRRLCNCC
jgi:hypothetical protein